MRRKYMVVVEWTDGEVADADELAVFAASPSQAISLARSIWSATKGAAWPHCRVSKVLILTRRMMRSLA
jgi:ureidoglycolate hydrolase